MPRKVRLAVSLQMTIECTTKSSSLNSALCYRNGVIEETGVAAGVLNHPAMGVAWLANKLAPYGQALEVGEVILGGSFTRPVYAQRGDTFHIDYGSFGSISCRFV